MKPVVLFLTCANTMEADMIARKLLEDRLIVCAKRVDSTSMYRWKGKIESARECLLIMDSLEGNYQKVEQVIGTLHSYESFVLLASPVTQCPTKVLDWMKDELSQR